MKSSDRLLTIEEIKANPAYDEYLKTMSYGEAQRACQRDQTAKSIRTDLLAILKDACDLRVLERQLVDYVEELKEGNENQAP